MMPLQQALPWIAGARLVGDGSVRVQRVHTDTRSIAPGDLFVALQGEKFDANQMLLAAQAQGAAAVLCRAGPPACHAWKWRTPASRWASWPAAGAHNLTCR